jgi:hypothetical protein
MRMIAPRMFANVFANMRSASPRRLSIVSMSFANRFMIRPSGVVSKNESGAWMTRPIAARCRLREAAYVKNAKTTPIAKSAPAWETPSAA